jgi:hypothetical protein
MKIVAVDAYGRDTIDAWTVAEKIPSCILANRLANVLNDNFGNNIWLYKVEEE